MLPSGQRRILKGRTIVIVHARKSADAVQMRDQVEARAQSRERTSTRQVLQTRGELEAGICAEIARIERFYMGRGPADISVHLIGDLLIVRLHGVLTAAEQQLVARRPSARGRELLKQMRTCLLESARPMLEAIVKEITGADVVSLHHDISSFTGEEFVLFSLAAAPRFCET